MLVRAFPSPYPLDLILSAVRGFVVILAIFCVSELRSDGQGFQVRNWHIENGLPDGTVTALAQTPDGYVWVGTHKGLVRFDGDSFKRVEPAGDHTLKDPRIVSLMTDRQGGLWIASESGLITRFAEGEFRVRYSPTGVGQTGKSDGIHPAMAGWQNLNCLFALDGSGTVWTLGIEGDVLRFSGPGAPEKITPEDLPPGTARGLTSDTAGQVWLLNGTSAGVFENGKWSYSASAGVRVPGDMLCSAGGIGLWTSEASAPKISANLVEYKMDTGWTTRSIPIPTTPAHPPISAMLQDHRGQVWMAVRWGGVYYQSRNGQWTQVQETGPLAKCTVRCLFEDRQGSIWVGTVGEGLNHVVAPSVEMAMLPAEAADVHVTTVCAGRSGLWMGTDKSLYHQAYGGTAQVDHFEELEGESIYALLEDARTNLWVGTQSGLFERGSDGFKRILSPEVSYGGIYALFEDHAGNIWAGSHRGTLMRVRGGDQPIIEQANGNPSLRICCIAENDRGQIWVATRTTGLWRLEGGQLVPAGPHLADFEVDTRSLFFDKDGVLWIGTYGDGLFRLSNHEVKRYTTDDGLQDDVILGLLGDEQGNIWMTTRNGILGCSRRQLAYYVRGQSAPLLCKRLGLDEGLANRECTGAGQPVISRGPDGRFWAATMVGAAGFVPGIPTGTTSATEVHIENLTVDGAVQKPLAQGFRVSATARHFEFQYSAPELAAPKTLRFRYRLDGLDRNWVEAGSSRIASYSRLPPGEYQFHVMAGGVDGIWREAKTPIILNVVPRFWQTGWFRTLAAAMIGLVLIGAVVLNERRKARRRLERLEAQQAVERVRRKIARDLHDELGSAITEIMQLGDLAIQPEPAPKQLQTSMETMTVLVRQLGISLDEIVWTMSSRNNTLPNLVGYISNHAQEFFRHSGIVCRLDVTKNLPGIEVDSQTRHNLFLAVKEALNNVAKHSRASEVVVRVHYHECLLRVVIEDNGQGFDPEAHPSGEGLTNIRERLQAVLGEVEFLPSPGAGTKVVFTLNLEAVLRTDGK